jgi:HlyD family secretion protein
MPDPMLSPARAEHDANRISFDQLDALIRVTTVQSWVYLATLFAVSVAAIAFAIFYRVPTKVHGEGILLIDKDTLVQVRAGATGRLTALQVKLGDRVHPEDEIGQISQDDLGDTIREDEARLTELRREDQELTQFEQAEGRSKDDAISNLRTSIVRAQADSAEKLKLAQRVVSGAEWLRSQRHLGDQELLESREKLYETRDGLNKGESRLAELNLDQVTSQNARRRAQIERRIKIVQLEKKLSLAKAKLARTSHVRCHASGEVVQVLAARDELVHEGSPIVLLHSPKSEQSADDSGEQYECIVFVPAGEGKKINRNDAVEVVPATIKREEHGFIRGSVVALSELPATRLAMGAALEHPELVDAFLKRYAPGVVLRVQVELHKDLGPEDPERRNAFLWSSYSGRSRPLKTGTMCQASIVVDRRRLITLILPWMWKQAGGD